MTDESLHELLKAADSPRAIDSLRALAELRREVQRREAVLVRRARNDGASWAQIAEALGVSKQSAHRKYGGKGFLLRGS
ncbi:helix-turn-helix domain-containing protein [Phytoactinopolyspora mesophila]|uniref:HTH domain-containing protein n=1 Tax=Phytoactinopolyspora mesophila TaxID=2650750 RepID=A0A7K3M1W2_9ACTN|nr:helix-turn-helix domain-containing protein [Phytoactinopolyspora mesophila]NDL57274.1 hypothetical protein [Phytoactinopolyspora mesophila]